ncbi:MAG: rod shape-determining protein MreD [Lachnospiraceae bacterium]|nr:rod shape-determining protein MreD [Lachnospiraceae bacterium]
MKNNIIIGLMVLICFILQSTFFQTFSFGGISPNLLIVLTAAFGFMRGKKCGLLVGFFSGLLVDLFFGDVLCFYALIYMYIGYGNGLFRRIFFKEDIKLPMVLITVSDMVYSMLCYLLLFLLRSKFQFSYYFIHIIIPEMVYTIVITIVLYPLILFINSKLEGKNQRSEGSFV